MSGFGTNNPISITGESMFFDKVAASQSDTLNKTINTTIQTGFVVPDTLYDYPSSSTSSSWNVTSVNTWASLNQNCYSVIDSGHGNLNTSYSLIASENTDISCFFNLSASNYVTLGSGLYTGISGFSPTAGFSNYGLPVNIVDVNGNGIQVNNIDTNLVNPIGTMSPQNSAVSGVNFSFVFTKTDLQFESVTIYTPNHPTDGYTNSPRWVLISGSKLGALNTATQGITETGNKFTLLSAQTYTFTGAENGVHTYAIPSYGTGYNKFNVCVVSTGGTSLNISAIQFNRANVKGVNYIGNNALNNVVIGTYQKPVNFVCSAPTYNGYYTMPFGVIRVSPDELSTVVVPGLQYNVFNTMPFTISNNQLPIFKVYSTYYGNTYENAVNDNGVHPITLDILLGGVTSIYSTKPVLNGLTYSPGVLVTNPTIIDKNVFMCIKVISYTGSYAYGLKCSLFWS